MLGYVSDHGVIHPIFKSEGVDLNDPDDYHVNGITMTTVVAKQFAMHMVLEACMSAWADCDMLRADEQATFASITGP